MNILIGIAGLFWIFVLIPVSVYYAFKWEWEECAERYDRMYEEMKQAKRDGLL